MKTIKMSVIDRIIAWDFVIYAPIRTGGHDVQLIERDAIAITLDYTSNLVYVRNVDTDATSVYQLDPNN